MFYNNICWRNYVRAPPNHCPSVPSPAHRNLPASTKIFSLDPGLCSKVALCQSKHNPSLTQCGHLLLSPNIYRSFQIRLSHHTQRPGPQRVKQIQGQEQNESHMTQGLLKHHKAAHQMEASNSRKEREAGKFGHSSEWECLCASFLHLQNMICVTLLGALLTFTLQPWRKQAVWRLPAGTIITRHRST